MMHYTLALFVSIFTSFTRSDTENVAVVPHTNRQIKITVPEDEIIVEYIPNLSIKTRHPTVTIPEDEIVIYNFSLSATEIDFRFMY